MPETHHRSDARVRVDRRVRRCDERARERRRARHLLGRRQALGDDRHRLRVGLRRAADRPRLARLGRRRARDAIAATRRFGVSILAEEQLAVARFGSAPGAAKFLEPFVDPGDGSSASPVVAGALAHLDCELPEAVQVADHTILFGRVRAARARTRGTPLLYHRRAYRTLGDPCRGRPIDRKELRCLSS